MTDTSPTPANTDRPPGPAQDEGAAAPARRAWLVGAGVLAALAGLGGALWLEGRRSGVPLGDGFWSQRFPTPDGGELALASLRGRPLLLNFWATWCPPCVREMPALDRFQQAHGARGWQVLGLAVDGPTPVREFLQRTPVSYPIALAGLGGTQLTRALGNDAGGLPFSVLINADGRMIDRHLGELSEAQLQEWAARM